MHISRFLPAAALLGHMVLAGCASQINESVNNTLTQHHVGPATTVKMQNGRALDYNDIVELVRRGVPGNIIVGYLQSTGKVYNFGPVQLQALRDQGASDQVLNFLQETQGFYGRTTPAQSQRLSKEQSAEYYNTPLYQDQAPFAYNQPIVDDWYDSGYEESLYSPFSYN